MVLEIQTLWSGPGSADKRTIMYFEDTAVFSTTRAAVAAFWEALEGNITADYTWVVAAEGRRLDTATGGLTGVENDPTVYQGAGTGTAGSQVADATQALIRWATGIIVGGRRLQGRTFIPGTPRANTQGGNLSSFAVVGISSTANTFISGLGTDNKLVVWHRPSTSSGGVAHPVTQASTWSELAVLRRRRG